MTTKKIVRTIEFTIERSERFLMSRRRQFSGWCAVCQNRAEFVLPEKIALCFAIRQREIFRLIENGDLGFTELPEKGLLLVCLDCFGRKCGEEKDEK